MRPNKLKRRLESGGVARGLSMMIPSPQIVEIAGLIGFDWVLLDCEHGTMTLESVELMAMAAEASGITAVARPRSSAPEAILEVLERGVSGVQVPHVNSAAQAKEVVASVLYHPHGSRGLAARTRPAGYGLGIPMDEYVRRANRELLICLQLEDRSALQNIEEILAVQGVDVIFVGPSDLSQSLGHPGSADHPDVVSAMEQAFAAVRRHGRIAGSAGGARQWKDWAGRGVQYLYAHLPAVLAEGSKPFVEQPADN
jgi:4-hydroxy-2-oxoheptanedioate aldolase